MRSVLAQLQRRRLISLYGEGEKMVGSVHPIVRAHFYPTTDDARVRFHGAAGDHLNVLVNRPHRRAEPIEPEVLDLLEAYTYHVAESGDVMDAVNIYAFQLGGYRHLGWRLGDYHRGLRLTSRLVEVGGIELQALESVRPWYDRALFHLDLGHPALAEGQMRGLLQVYKVQLRRQDELRALLRDEPSSMTEAQIEEFMIMMRWARSEEEVWFFYEATLLQSLCDALLAQGKLVAAELVATQAIETPGDTSWEDVASIINESGANPFGRRAVARSRLGKVAQALADFHQAEALREKHRPALPYEPSLPFGGYHGAQHVLLLARLGRLQAARALLQECDLEAARALRPLLAAQYELARAEVELAAGDETAAVSVVEAALAWSMQFGHQETYVRASLAKARVFLRNDNLRQAQEQLQEAEQVARAASFNTHLADLLVLTGYCALHTGQLARAAALATEARAISSDEACSYRWGAGDACHLLAEVELQRGNVSAAVREAEEAVRIREALGDPRVENTRSLIERAQRGAD